MEYTMKLSKALIVVDVQRDFMTGGALAVPLANEALPAPETILPFIHGLMVNDDYARVVLTQDFHPVGHISFAATLGVPLYSMAKTPAGRDQVAWPIHCLAGTEGADFSPGLATHLAHAIIRKGTQKDFDSYSGFVDDGGAVTGLAGYLHANRIGTVDIVGIATDYCVKATALGAKDNQFDTHVLLQGCAGVAAKTIQAAIAEMRMAGITIVA